MKRKFIQMYRTPWHLGVTFALVFLPFLYFFVYSLFRDDSSIGLFSSLGISGLRLFIAYLISVVLAWIMAVLFYTGNRAAIALPLFDVLQSFPTFAALPLAVILLGQSTKTVILFLVLTVIWPIFFSIISGLKRINRDWREAVQIAGLNRWQYFRLFLWPVTIPGIITGSIIGLGEGWEALVATEIIVGNVPGLGAFFESVTASPALTSFGILGLLLFIFSINKLLWIPLLDWSHKTTGE